MTTQPPDDFLIGALVYIVGQSLNQRLEALFPLEGFPEIRPIHTDIFRNLPPEGCRLSTLAELCYTTRQAIGYLVDYLENCGYLERVPDPTDHRAAIIRRTQRGWEIHGLLKQIVYQIQQEWTLTFGEARMEAMLMLMREFVRDVIRVDYADSLSARGIPPGSSQ